jgi:hypothetical protein
MAAGGVSRDRMRRAGLLVAAEARRLAGAWSKQIPPEISVRAYVNKAIITSQVGPSYPNEMPRVRHPVFGPTLRNPRPGWVTNAHRPFLAPAAAAKADDATREIAKTIDDYCRELGFEETP